jgi:hypothetical protein
MMVKYILFFISVSVTLQFDHFFNGNNRILPSILIVFFSLIYLTFQFVKMRGVRVGSLLLVVIGFLLSALYMMAWMPFADTSLFLTTSVTFIPLFILVGIIRDAVPRLEKKNQAFIFNQTVNFAIAALLIECYFRLSKPLLSLPENTDIFKLEYQLQNINFETFFTDGFYVYKSSSIMFYDSNYVGVFALLILVFLFFARSNAENAKRQYNVKIFIVVSLVLLSFSRASIATGILLVAVEAFFIFKRRSPLLLYIYVSTVTILAIAAFYLAADFILNDPSFHTKLDTVRSLGKITDIGMFELFFGYGFNKGSFLYSYEPGAYAHAAIPLLMGIVGLSGLLLYFGLMTFYSIKLGVYGFYLIIVILVNGFSILDPWQLMIYWGFAYMYAMKFGSSKGDSCVIRFLTDRKVDYSCCAIK